MKTIYLIHGWGGNPNGDWYKWLVNELKINGITAYAPEMPDTFNPTIKKWIGKLNEVIKNPDEDTYFVGHSIGCQAIMRYLEQLPKNIKIGGVIFVAGWFNLTDDTWDEDYTKEIADEWINTPINFNKIKQHTKIFVDIASDNDPYVPLTDIKLFKERLNAEVITLKGKGHISGEDGVKEFPLLLNKILEITK